jgi:hypothetical protein
MTGNGPLARELTQEPGTLGVQNPCGIGIGHFCCFPGLSRCGIRWTGDGTRMDAGPFGQRP